MMIQYNYEQNIILKYKQYNVYWLSSNKIMLLLYVSLFQVVLLTIKVSCIIWFFKVLFQEPYFLVSAHLLLKAVYHDQWDRENLSPSSLKTGRR